MMLEEVNQVIQAIQASSKYRHICRETLEHIAQRALRQSRSEKEAVKRAKRKLHQICASFMAPDMIVRALALLEASTVAGKNLQRETALDLLRLHASTRERINLLESLYPTIFAITGVPLRVLDLGCGLHPFALRWMHLPPEAEYIAYDIDSHLIDLLNVYFSRSDFRAKAWCRDVIASPPEESADIAFLLKTVPTLEQEEKGSVIRLLRAVPAAFFVLSFPTASLGGRHKGMRSHYSEMMSQLLESGAWSAERLDFPQEMFYVIRNIP